MSIKGLSDRGMSFPEIGQIRKGAPKTENAPGKDLQYFRVTFDEQEVKAAETFKSAYGETPAEINILLFSDEIESSWQNWLEAYTAGRMVARSDGEKFIYLVDTNTGEIIVKDGQPYKKYVEGEPVGTYKSNGKEEKIYCKPAGRLKVLIPELQRLVYLVVLTTSIHDIINISSQLQMLKEINHGRLAGIPMVLRRRPKKISTPKADGSRARYSKWMLSIEVDPEWVKAKLLEVKHLALPGNGMDLLPAGDQIIDVESRDVEADIPEVEDEPEEDIPSEPEMDGDQVGLFPEADTKWTAEQINTLMNAEDLKLKVPNHIVNTLNFSKKLDGSTPSEIALAWVRIYKSARENKKLDSVQSAEYADKEMFGK